MDYKLYLLVAFFLSATIFSCKSTMQKNLINEDRFNPMYPAAIVFKPKKNYGNLVSIVLDSTKSSIVSYPAPSDVFYKGKLATPFPLEKGYFLDNRNVNLNSAILDITLEEYSKLANVPTEKYLISKIIEKNPYLEIYNCGNRYKFTNEIEELNFLIKNNLLKKNCKCLKK